MQNRDSSSREDFSCAAALASLKKDIATLKRIILCDHTTNTGHFFEEVENYSSGSNIREGSVSGMKNRQVNNEDGSSDIRLDEDMHINYEHDTIVNSHFESDIDVTKRLLREALARVNQVEKNYGAVKYKLDRRSWNNVEDSVAGMEMCDKGTMADEEMDRGHEEETCRQLDLDSNNKCVNNNEEMVSEIEEIRGILNDNERQNEELLILKESTDRISTNIDNVLEKTEPPAMNSDEFFHGIDDHVSKNSIDSVIHKESLLRLLSRNKEIEDKCIKLCIEFDNMQIENERVREELKRLQQKINDVSICKINNESLIDRERTEYDSLEKVELVNAFAENKDNNDRMKKDIKVDHHEDLINFIAEVTVEQSLKYVTRTMEIDQRYSKELSLLIESIAKLKYELEDERKEKLKALGMLESNEKRIETTMNELNATMGSWENSKELMKQDKNKLKAMTSQLEILETEVTNLKKEMGEKSKEKEELEKLCLELTKNCDILIEKCHMKDEDLKKLQGELNSAVDEVIILKNKVAEQDFTIETLNSAKAKLIAEYSIKYGPQSNKASKDMNHNVNDSQALAQEENPDWKDFKSSEKNVVKTERQATFLIKDYEHLSMENQSDSQLVGLDVEDKVENDNKPDPNDLKEINKKGDELLRDKGSSLSIIVEDSSEEQLIICCKKFTNKDLTQEDESNEEMLHRAAELIVNQSVNDAIRTNRLESYVTVISRRLKWESLNSSKKQMQIDELLASNKSLQNENKQVKNGLETVIATSSRILEEYCNSFMKMASSSNCDIDLEDIDNMKKQLVNFTEKCMNENFSQIIPISPHIGRKLLRSQIYRTLKNNDNNGRMMRRKKKEQVEPMWNKNLKTEKIEPYNVKTGRENANKSEEEGFEDKSFLNRMHRPMAKYICDMAISRALMQLGIESDEILKYYEKKRDTQINQKYNISFEQEAGCEETMLAVTAINEEDTKLEKQQQMLPILEECDPLLMHEMESLKDLFFRFRTAKMIKNYAHQMRRVSAQPSELEKGTSSLESLLSNIEEGFGEIRAPSITEDCLIIAELVIIHCNGYTF